MKSVGVRELKNRLSEYLRLVRAGEEILVTDRDEAVAQLVRPRLQHSENPGVDLLVSQGLATAGAKNARRLYPRMSRALKDRSAAELLDEERGPR